MTQQLAGVAVQLYHDSFCHEIASFRTRCVFMSGTLYIEYASDNAVETIECSRCVG